MGRHKKGHSKLKSTSLNCDDDASITLDTNVNKQGQTKQNGNDSKQKSSTQSKISHSILKLPETSTINEKESKDLLQAVTKANDATNAFKLLMDSRSKSIGQNEEGILLKQSTGISDTDKPNDLLLKEANNAKLLRKAKFNAWAQTKVSVKRKLQEEEDEARDLFINETMAKRSKRLRGMLNINVIENLVDDDSDLDYSPYRKSVKKHKKRRKMKEKKQTRRQSNTSVLSSNLSKIVKIPSDTEQEVREPKRLLKLAPIFRKAKQQIDLTTLEARKSFLHSDLPNSLKSKFERTSSTDTSNYFGQFPLKSHIQQKSDSHMWNLPRHELLCKELLITTISVEDIINQVNTKELSIINRTENRTNIVEKKFATVRNLCAIIGRIKAENPHYPVYKTFKSLCMISGCNPKMKQKLKRKSNNDTIIARNSTIWTEKYKPKSSKDFIGNSTNVLELQKWLSNWTNNSRRESKYTSESEFDSDSDSISNGLLNGMILVGPHGTGKTASVYAVATELGYNIIELNASSKRTGKKLIQELQEATQSHQLHKHDSKMIFSMRNGKERNMRQQNKLCLLLVDDVDIIFEQDEGFIFSLTQLLQTSKRPIILTATDHSSSHLQRFLNQYPTLRYKQLSIDNQIVWLKLLSAMEGLLVDVTSLTEMLEWYKGDLRKTMLHLQFWLLSGGNCLSKGFRTTNEKDVNRVDIIDEDDYLIDFKQNKRNSIQDEKHHGDCLNTFYPIIGLIPDPIDLEICRTNMRDAIFKMHNATDDFTLTNYTTLSSNLCSCNLMKKNIERDFLHGNKITDSLELNECLEPYDENDVISQEITRYILESTLKKFVDKETFNWSFKRSISKPVPYTEEVEKCLPFNISLDYDSFHLDYCPAIRAIARFEEDNLKNNLKRSNRFYNYLNNVGIKCSSSIIESLCKSLNYEDNKSY